VFKILKKAAQISWDFIPRITSRRILRSEIRRRKKKITTVRLWQGCHFPTLLL